MKCTIPEISWHNRDPILSVDIQPVNNEFYKLASGGTDCHVLIWHLKISQNGSVDVHIVSDLSRHQRSVNVVRWSPTGTYLASGDDDANIIIWNLRSDNVPLFEGETNDEENWIVTKILRGHKEDVYDLSWSPNETKLVSGSIDNTAILWDFAKGQSDNILLDHKGFVQGVSWDPKGEYIATICSDRICRVFDNSGKHVIARIHKGHLPASESHVLYNNEEVKYFHDDTFKSYFRRLNFSPDGNLLIVPSGCIETGNDKVVLNAAYIFTLDVLTEPAAIIPFSKQVTIAVRCCPILFELRSDGVNPLVDLPYRMIIAVATDSDVVLYDTQQVAPFAHFRKIHYTRITDLTWSSDGLLLIASSTDGFCTLITFEPDELGLHYVKEESEIEDSQMQINVSGCEEIANLDTSIKNEEKEEMEIKKPTILEQWAVRTPRSEGILPTRETPVQLEINDKVMSNQPKKLVPKRIVPTRVLDSPTQAPFKVQENVKCTDDIVTEDSSSTENNQSDISNSLKKDSTYNTPTRHKIDSKKSSILRFFQAANNKSSATIKTDQQTTDSADIRDTKKNCTDSDVIEILDSDDSNMSVTETCSANPKHSKTVTDENGENKEKENIGVLNRDKSDLTQCVPVTETTENKESTQLKINTIKTPRRIPFVTLGSPKRKKKE